ncbi:MAG: IQ calmodulin-binding motif-containing protein, partial [Simkaniaceae bacterium]|nr:IQ calmodulin-binding motif-containing protein [Simkaniaceae bacterium]
MASISPATTSTSFSPISMEDATSLLDDCSAIKIQKIWRGFRDRREVKKLARHVLEFPLFQRAIEYIRADLCSLPRAAVGKTPVYLPKEHPIAIKDLGSKKANDRFKRIKQARRLCEINGFHRLVIPKCRIYHDALIENRLPIDPYDLKAQLCLYAEHKDKFTEAVKELTHLLCQARLKHITTRYGDGFQLLSERSPIGRYDNLPLFLEDGIGKIGLIDLERFSLETPQVQKHVESACENLIHLFPHHFDAIMDISKSYCSGITFFYALFKTYGDDALHRLHIVYESHLEFILNQGITLTEPQTIVLPAPEQEETIVGHVFNEAKYNYKLHPFVNPLFG